MAFSIENSTGFYLQFTCVYIAGNGRVAAELQQVFGLYIARYFANDISLVAGNVSFHHAIGADDHFCCAVNVADDSAVDTKVTVAADVAFQGSTGTDEGSAAAI